MSDERSHKRTRVFTALFCGRGTNTPYNNANGCPSFDIPPLETLLSAQPISIDLQVRLKCWSIVVNLTPIFPVPKFHVLGTPNMEISQERRNTYCNAPTPSIDQLRFPHDMRQVFRVVIVNDTPHPHPRSLSWDTASTPLILIFYCY